MKKCLSVLIAALLLLMLCACGSKEPAAPEKQSDDWVNPQFNEYTLTKLRMVGKGDESSGYKVAFFPPETLDGAEGFLVSYSVREFDEVWKYLSSLTREEILALDKPANRAYVMTDLSYCDGVGNTLNTAQKDLITGDDFTEPGTHYFYAAVFGADGLLSLEKAAQTAYIAPSAGKLRFTREGSVLTGTFASDTEGEIETNYVFLSANGYAAVKEQLSGADRTALDALSNSGCALRFDNAGSTEFSLDLSKQKDLDGNAVDPARCYYVYVASASAETLMGVSYCAERFITPEALPDSSGTIGSSSGILFPNGGAASIGGDRSSIISTSQAIFRGFPDTPRVAVIGASSGSERELWSYFYQDTPSVRSFEHRFADAGFEAVYIPLTAENRDTIGSDAYFASLVSSCHGVYFTGGNQSLGIYALQNADGDWNAVGQAVQDLFARGGFLAGTSAGAHMLGSVCFQDADSHAALTHAKPTEAVLTAAGVVCGEEGALYGGLPCDAAACGAALTFDSHFGARGRLARLCTMQRSGGAAYAVGLDEATGIAVTGGVGTVYGAGTVTVLDNRSAVYGNDDSHFSVSDLRVFVLSAGDQFDFTSGTLIASPAKEAPAKSAAPEQPEDFLASGSAQTRALLTFALSGEESMHYPVAADGEKFTLRVEKSDDFSVVSSEKNYAASALSDLPQCAVSGLLLSIS